MGAELDALLLRLGEKVRDRGDETPEEKTLAKVMPPATLA
jgi:hypothetical protein